MVDAFLFVHEDALIFSNDSREKNVGFNPPSSLARPISNFKLFATVLIKEIDLQISKKVFKYFKI